MTWKIVTKRSGPQKMGLPGTIADNLISTYIIKWQERICQDEKNLFIHPFFAFNHPPHTECKNSDTDSCL